MSGCTHPREEATETFEAYDWVTGERFAVCACGRCGLAVTAPQPSDLTWYYPSSYYGSAGAARFPLPVEWLQGVLYARRARAVTRLAGGPGRVLDVGCGRGRLLAAFRARGWEVHGTELSDTSAAHPRALGFPVHVGALEDGPWPEGSLDAVVMWHVLEHWPDPAVPVARAARLLRPGGVLAIGVPNFASPEARLTRAGWFHLDVPRHLAHLDVPSLARLLEGSGLAVRRWSHLAPEYDAFSFVQSAENALGLPQNLLYRLLRRRGAKLGAGAGPGAVVASLALALPLGALSLPLTLALSALGRGSSITALAVKQR